MKSIIRNLEIYSSIGIGDSKTIEISKLLNDMFVGLTVSTQEDGNILYSRDGKWLLVQDEKNKWLCVDYDHFWSVFETKYCLTVEQTQACVTYIMYKHYKIKEYTPVCIFFCIISIMYKHYKIKEYTPMSNYFETRHAMYKHYKIKEYTTDCSW